QNKQQLFAASTNPSIEVGAVQTTFDEGTTMTNVALLVQRPCLNFKNTNPAVQIIVPTTRHAKTSYSGSTNSDWADTKNANLTCYKNIYPNIDLLVNRGVQPTSYILLIQPNANLSVVTVQCQKEGMTLEKPIFTQERQGKETKIDGNLVLQDKTIHLVAPQYNQNELLKIDVSNLCSLFSDERIGLK
ncbi:MAG: hypothetical protein RLZZ292_3061, partial [Bacteroidota bacterium]